MGNFWRKVKRQKPGAWIKSIEYFTKSVLSYLCLIPDMTCKGAIISRQKNGAQDKDGSDFAVKYFNFNYYYFLQVRKSCSFQLSV